MSATAKPRIKGYQYVATCTGGAKFFLAPTGFFEESFGYDPVVDPRFPEGTPSWSKMNKHVFSSKTEIRTLLKAHPDALKAWEHYKRSFRPVYEERC